jgi:ribosomal protein S18 acetylase RimI-like enzyme
MIIKKYQSLNEKAIKEVLALEKECNDFDQHTGSVFLDTSLNFNQTINSVFLVFERQMLVSMLSMFIPSHSEVEISAMTRPEYRRNGYFKALLLQAIEELRTHKIPDILFVSERPSMSGKRVLEALNATYEHTEYYMSLSKVEPTSPERHRLALVRPSLQELEKTIQLSIRIFEDDYADSKSLIENCFNSQSREQFLVTLDEKAIGLVSVNHLGPEEASIFGLGLLPEFRGSGYGKELLHLVLEYLWRRGKTQITLEVDSKNERAFRLYQKIGFRIELAYDYYRKKLVDFF